MLVSKKSGKERRKTSQRQRIVSGVFQPICVEEIITYRGLFWFYREFYNRYLLSYQYICTDEQFNAATQLCTMSNGSEQGFRAPKQVRSQQGRFRVKMQYFFVY
jgi:hypothetical protein